MWLETWRPTEMQVYPTNYESPHTPPPAHGAVDSGTESLGTDFLRICSVLGRPRRGGSVKVFT